MAFSRGLHIHPPLWDSRSNAVNHYKIVSRFKELWTAISNSVTFVQQKKNNKNMLVTETIFHFLCTPLALTLYIKYSLYLTWKSYALQIKKTKKYEENSRNTHEFQQQGNIYNQLCLYSKACCRSMQRIRKIIQRGRQVGRHRTGIVASTRGYLYTRRKCSVSVVGASVIAKYSRFDVIVPSLTLPWHSPIE